jgi:hypothetical protein
VAHGEGGVLKSGRARERLIRVKIPATLVVSVYAVDKKEGEELARGIFGRSPHNARLLTHKDSDNILFAVVANREAA